MGYNIAVAGKGGTGKTSLTGLLVNNLTTNNKGPVLVVDADANANINEVLGIDFKTINYVDDPIGMWAQVKVSNIPFTNAAKGNIIKITEVLNFGRINNEILYKYGLYVSMTAGKILNLNPKNITKMYNKLPIKSREDIDIDSKYIASNFGTGKIIGSIYQDLESSILKGKLKNKKKEIIKYLNERK